MAIVVSGVGIGFVYGLLGFSIVLLFKCTGIANFAAGAMATTSAFLVLKIAIPMGLSTPLTALVAVGLAAFLGAALHIFVMTPLSSRVDRVSLTIRALGVSLLLVAALDARWGAGGPYQFPLLVKGHAASVGALALPWQTILGVGVTIAVATVFAILFRFTDIGLMYRAIAESTETSRLLGLRVGTMALGAWIACGLITLFVGVLVAPTALLGSDMMDGYLLYAFAAVILGGITSLPGALLGGVIIGAISTTLEVHVSTEWATLVVFVILVGTIAIRPAGLLGRAEVARL